MESVTESVKYDFSNTKKLDEGQKKKKKFYQSLLEISGITRAHIKQISLPIKFEKDFFSKFNSLEGYDKSFNNKILGYTNNNKSFIPNESCSIKINEEDAIDTYNVFVYIINWIICELFEQCDPSVEYKRDDILDKIEGLGYLLQHEKKVNSESFPFPAWVDFDDYQCRLECEALKATSEPDEYDFEWVIFKTIIKNLEEVVEKMTSALKSVEKDAEIVKLYNDRVNEVFVCFNGLMKMLATYAFGDEFFFFKQYQGWKMDKRLIAFLEKLKPILTDSTKFPSLKNVNDFCEVFLNTKKVEEDDGFNKKMASNLKTYFINLDLSDKIVESGPTKNVSKKRDREDSNLNEDKNKKVCNALANVGEVLDKDPLIKNPLPETSEQSIFKMIVDELVSSETETGKKNQQNSNVLTYGMVNELTNQEEFEEVQDILASFWNDEGVEKRKSRQREITELQRQENELREKEEKEEREREEQKEREEREREEAKTKEMLQQFEEDMARRIATKNVRFRGGMLTEASEEIKTIEKNQKNEIEKYELEEKKKNEAQSEKMEIEFAKPDPKTKIANVTNAISVNRNHTRASASNSSTSRVSVRLLSRTTLANKDLRLHSLETLKKGDCEAIEFYRNPNSTLSYASLSDGSTVDGLKFFIIKETPAQADSIEKEYNTYKRISEKFRESKAEQYFLEKNVVKLYAINKTSKLLFYKLVASKTIEGLIESAKSVPSSMIFGLVNDLIRTLHKLNSKDIGISDFKFSNIMSDSKTGHAVMIDLGGFVEFVDDVNEADDDDDEGVNPFLFSLVQKPVEFTLPYNIFYQVIRRWLSIQDPSHAIYFQLNKPAKANEHLYSALDQWMNLVLNFFVSSYPLTLFSVQYNWHEKRLKEIFKKDIDRDDNDAQFVKEFLAWFENFVKFIRKVTKGFANGLFTQLIDTFFDVKLVTTLIKTLYEKTHPIANNEYEMIVLNNRVNFIKDTSSSIEGEGYDFETNMTCVYFVKAVNKAICNDKNIKTSINKKRKFLKDISSEIELYFSKPDGSVINQDEILKRHYSLYSRFIVHQNKDVASNIMAKTVKAGNK